MTTEELRSRSHHVWAELNLLFEKQGDAIARSRGYKTLRGRDAIDRFLVDKHHWTLDYAQHLSPKDLLILLDGEIED